MRALGGGRVRGPEAGVNCQMSPAAFIIGAADVPVCQSPQGFSFTTHKHDPGAADVPVCQSPQGLSFTTQTSMNQERQTSPSAKARRAFHLPPKQASAKLRLRLQLRGLNGSVNLPGPTGENPSFFLRQLREPNSRAQKTPAVLRGFDIYAADGSAAVTVYLLSLARTLGTAGASADLSFPSLAARTGRLATLPR